MELRKKLLKKYLKFIVRIRMWYGKARGHQGKRWNYEPSRYYMGRKKK